MKKIFSLFYGMACYAAFFVTILYAIGFMGNIVVTKTIDGKPEIPLFSAILVDVSLILLFAFQQSIMARSVFKSSWTRNVPPHLKRATYVVVSSLCLMLLMWKWRPIGGVLWSVEDESIKTLLLFAYLLGWSFVFASTFLINHFDLFGLRQVWLYFLGRPYKELPVRTPSFYKLVRHPLYTGFLIAFWSAPVMTVAHLLFAMLTTAYIVAAIQFEERDLLHVYGEKYREYKKWMPLAFPFSKRKTVKNQL